MCGLAPTLNSSSSTTRSSGGIDFAVAPTALSDELDQFPAVSGTPAADASKESADSHLGATGDLAGTRLQRMVERQSSRWCTDAHSPDGERAWCDSRTGGPFLHNWAYGVEDIILGFEPEDPGSTPGTPTYSTTTATTTKKTEKGD